MFSKKFLVDTAERVISTMAETAAGIIGVDAVVSAFAINWKYVGGMVLGSGLLTFCKALYARNHGDPEKASLVQ